MWVDVYDFSSKINDFHDFKTFSPQTLLGAIPDSMRWISLNDAVDLSESRATPGIIFSSAKLASEFLLITRVTFRIHTRDRLGISFYVISDDTIPDLSE